MFVLGWTCGCQAVSASRDGSGTAATATPPSLAKHSPSPGPSAPFIASGSAANTEESRPPQTLRIFLGGDVSFGRSVGQRLLAKPALEPFSGIQPWLDSADLCIVNLESVLSDERHTEHPYNPLVFSGPLSAAQTLKRAGIDAVSVANNHSWDYGLKGLRKSLRALDGAELLTAGASAKFGEQYRHAIWHGTDFNVAFLAFTQVWNDGSLDDHTAANYVASSNYDKMRKAVARARAEADFVVASLHASNEYIALPRERARKFAHGLLLSGADLVFAHHPHVVQGIEWVRGKPILYSLGNLVFDSHQDRPETRRGMVALVDVGHKAAIDAEQQTDEQDALHIVRLRLCPLHLVNALPRRDEDLAAFSTELVRLSKTLGGLSARSPDAAGCVEVVESPTPLPASMRHGFEP